MNLSSISEGFLDYLAWHREMRARNVAWHKFFPIVVIAAPLVISLLYLGLVPPQYAAVMTIAPNPDDPRTMQTATNDARSLAKSLGLGSGDAALPPIYSELLAKLASPSVAAQLIRRPDIMEHLYGGAYNPANSSLKTPRGFMYFLRYLITWGQYHRYRPGPVEVAQKLHAKIFVTPVGETTMRQVRLYDEDRVFAEKLLYLVFKLADTSIKQAEANRASELKQYLEGELKRSDSLTSSDMLRNMLAGAENQLALSSLQQPMSAQVVEPPTAGAAPERPNVALVLLFGFIISSSLGGAYLYYLFGWRGQVRGQDY